MTNRHTPHVGADVATTPRRVWVLAAGASLAVHAALVPAVWWLGRVPAAAGDAAPLAERLGVTGARALTLTWLGVETPEVETLDAPESPVDQTAFTTDPGEALAEEASAPPAPVETAPQPMPLEITEPIPVQAPPETDVPADIVVPVQREPQPIPEVKPSETPTPDAGDPGVPGERESVATVIERTIDARPGALASTDGLEILTRRIQWQVADRQLKLPHNPVVHLRFDSAGKPSRVWFAEGGRGQRLGTGYARMDETLLNALYRWRARGDRIDALGEGGSVEVRLRILLGAR